MSQTRLNVPLLLLWMPLHGKLNESFFFLFPRLRGLLRNLLLCIWPTCGTYLFTEADLRYDLL